MVKKKKRGNPKLRHVWAINPKTRVTPSKKQLSSRRGAKDRKKWLTELEEEL